MTATRSRRKFSISRHVNKECCLSAFSQSLCAMRQYRGTPSSGQRCLSATRLVARGRAYWGASLWGTKLFGEMSCRSEQLCMNPTGPPCRAVAYSCLPLLSVRVYIVCTSRCSCHYLHLLAQAALTAWSTLSPDPKLHDRMVLGQKCQGHAAGSLLHIRSLTRIRKRREAFGLQDAEVYIVHSPLMLLT